MMFRLLGLMASLAVISANPLKKNVTNEPIGRIVGGESTTIEMVPYQISLQIDGKHMCGGSIISENWVVTAGNCAKYNMNSYTVRAGSTFHDRGGSLHEVITIINGHRLNDPYGRPLNNIALIRVGKPFVFDKTRQPIQLYNADEESVADAMSTITGWGVTSSDSGILSPVLQIVHMPIVSKEVCYRQYDSIPEGQICAGYLEGGKAACRGDTGGPLAINGRLAGFSSWGRGCGRPGYPGVYTEVAYHREWIRKFSGV